MAAPKGNKFWELRAKHGRDKLFATPELLWEAALEYFNWVDANPITEQLWVGKDGDEKQKKHNRPYTKEGLCFYLGCDDSYFRQQKLKDDKDLKTVITRIEQTIYDKKYSGAAVGLYNANIIARDLGLSDKVANHVTIEQPFFGKEEN